MRGLKDMISDLLTIIGFALACLTREEYDRLRKQMVTMKINMFFYNRGINL
jgi:hypothetical protein